MSEETHRKQRASWSGHIAFVIAAAASAIGLGNLWRFPYLAAQYGGGTFILIYLLLVVTLGFTLMVTEIAIGRATRQSQLTAYSKLHRGFGFLGLLGTIIPILIVPYYCVIGGWVLKYFGTYLQMAFHPGSEILADPDAFFTGFITAPFAPFGYALVFILLTASVIVMGVKNGIEKSNLIMMPILFFMAIAISVYVICLPGSTEGLKYYLVPNLDGFRTAEGNFSLALMGKTILGAMGQMFYSLSLAMGIMITYGSYMRQEDSIEKAVRRIEIFDTLIAIIAGLMIIPVVYLFAMKTGTPVKTAMNAGPGLMFKTLPKVFAQFGAAGSWIGAAFFSLVVFAALTSAISLMEACVASVCDLLHINRKSATFFTTALVAFLAVFSAIGYGPWSKVTLLKMPFLDFFDFITNSVLMPIVAALTCIFVGWVLKPKVIEDELTSGGHRFAARGLYTVMIRYIAPILIAGILVSQVCQAFQIGKWSI
ncbi:MAG: sodium-dependent transporter [Kiritimatiellae bacterium]|nr:sodium-dependent transporter [Kiritimatiellia bacterium]